MSHTFQLSEVFDNLKWILRGHKVNFFPPVLRTTSFIKRCHPNVYTTSMALSVIVNGKKTLWLGLD